MTPIDPASNPHSTTNEITRRTFMKKSALTIGAVTILAQGVGFAEGVSCSCPAKTTSTGPESKTKKKRVDKELSYTHKRSGASFILLQTGTEADDVGSQTPPGSFPATLTKGSCNYTKDSTPPVTTTSNETAWTKTPDPYSGSNSGTSLPEGVDNYTYQSTREITCTKTITWTATQAYIISP